MACVVVIAAAGGPPLFLARTVARLLARQAVNTVLVRFAGCMMLLDALG